MQSMTQSSEMRDVVFVSLENWDDVWRRNQFLCAGLVKRFPGIKILFVGLSRDVSNDIRHGRLPNFSDTIERVPGFPRISLTRPIKLLPNTVPAFRRINEGLFRSHVAKAMCTLGLANPILWLNPHSAVHMVGKMGESAVVYDITDDWTSLTQSEALKKLTIAQDTELCRVADSVIVCSKRLHEMKYGLTKSLHLIPNGVDSDHYACVLDGGGPMPGSCGQWKKPVLGYVGTIHPDRVDLALVEQVAGLMPDSTIALVGPNFLDTSERQKLESCGNIIMTGPVAYAEVPQIMRSFAISITPHLVTPFTESLNPIKLWEYLAAGKPIVSTNVAGFRDYPQHVAIATSAQEFADACVKALSEPKSAAEGRRAEARKNSWDARVDAAAQVLKSCTRDVQHSDVQEPAHAF